MADTGATLLARAKAKAKHKKQYKKKKSVTNAAWDDAVGKAEEHLVGAHCHLVLCSCHPFADT